MTGEASRVDVRGLLLGAGAFLGLVEELMAARTWAAQNTVLLALNLQADNMQNEVIRVQVELERLRDEGGIGGGLLA